MYISLIQELYPNERIPEDVLRLENYASPYTFPPMPQPSFSMTSIPQPGFTYMPVPPAHTPTPSGIFPVFIPTMTLPPTTAAPKRRPRR